VGKDGRQTVFVSSGLVRERTNLLVLNAREYEWCVGHFQVSSSFKMQNIPISQHFFKISLCRSWSVVCYLFYE
jgi:hypothetical protein